MSKTKRIDSLDSIRGIASIVVMIYHCVLCFFVFYTNNIEPSTNIFLKVLNYTPFHLVIAGTESVLLFFVLSGFVLSLPFLNKKPYSYKSYALQRFCRIYIPYIFVMVLSSTLMILLSDYQPITELTDAFNHRWEHPLTIEAVFSYILMLGYDVNNVNGATWSLVHEMRISLIFPLLMLIIVRLNWIKSLLLGLGSMAFLWVLTKAIAQKIFISEPINYLLNSIGDTFFYCTFFIMGAVLAKCSHQVSKKIKKLKLNHKIILLALSFLLINKTLLNLIPFGQDGILSVLGSLIIQWIVALGIIILFSLVLNSKRIEAFLTKKSLLWVGKISYSIYLIHPVIIMLCGKFLSKLIPLSVAICLVPVFTLPIASLMYKYIEVVSIKLGKDFSVKKVSKSEQPKIKVS